MRVVYFVWNKLWFRSAWSRCKIPYFIRTNLIKSIDNAVISSISLFYFMLRVLVSSREKKSGSKLCLFYVLKMIPSKLFHVNLMKMCKMLKTLTTLFALFYSIHRVKWMQFIIPAIRKTTTSSFFARRKCNSSFMSVLCRTCTGKQCVFAELRFRNWIKWWNCTENGQLHEYGEHFQLFNEKCEYFLLEWTWNGWSC